MAGGPARRGTYRGGNLAARRSSTARMCAAPCGRRMRGGATLVCELRDSDVKVLAQAQSLPSPIRHLRRTKDAIKYDKCCGRSGGEVELEAILTQPRTCDHPDKRAGYAFGKEEVMYCKPVVSIRYNFVDQFIGIVIE
ncbi:hypothetical protein EVAR_53306_1 [Eumeta japonica]|uniref:Uncharacterized protein n=1 Tax=Eumeta variegata TaxID=151549 RepID=A0A4C1X7K8_EUMVA|nr:hypothetical protein EVAR_53306_1 [Eumeta japonica]